MPEQGRLQHIHVAEAYIKSSMCTNLFDAYVILLRGSKFYDSGFLFISVKYVAYLSAAQYRQFHLREI